MESGNNDLTEKNNVGEKRRSGNRRRAVLEFLKRSGQKLQITWRNVRETYSKEETIRAVTVNAPAGTIIGRVEKGVCSFKGIPYALPPIENRRFTAPKPAEPLVNFPALNFSPVCPQANPGALQSEDSLTLNIWTPSAAFRPVEPHIRRRLTSGDALEIVLRGGKDSAVGENAAIGEKPANDEKSADAKELADAKRLAGGEGSAGVKAAKPVLLFIHGGSFMASASSRRIIWGELLARRLGIVVVTFNYRLGVFGFLDFSFLDERFKSNCGLRDAALASRWVHENIAAFGGDPERITLMGESAGGALVAALLAMPQTRPYFSRAVMARSVVNAFITPGEGRKIAQEYLDYREIATAEELLALSALEIGATVRDFSVVSKRGVSAFKPIVDGELLTETPLAAFRAGRVEPLPIWLTVTRDELSILNVPGIGYQWGVNDIMDVGNEREDADLSAELRANYLDYYGEETADMHYVSDAFIRLAPAWLARTAENRMPVWFARFDWSSRLQDIAGLGAFHSSELYFFFGQIENGFGSLLYRGKKDRAAAKELIALVQADLRKFMYTGTLPWDPCRGDDITAKCYDFPLRYEQAIPLSLMELWEKTEYYKHSFDVYHYEREQLPQKE